MDLEDCNAEGSKSDQEAETSNDTPYMQNLSRYTDDTTLMAEREEELKSLLTKVKEESEKLA